MDSYLSHYAEVTKQVFPDADPDYPGSGAAGGLGFALHTFLNASLEPGAKLIIEETHLEDDILEELARQAEIQARLEALARQERVDRMKRAAVEKRLEALERTPPVPAETAAQPYWIALFVPDNVADKDAG